MTSEFHPPDGPTVTHEQEGRYRILREYGRGGMATVQLVEDAHVCRQVAFKEMLPQNSGDEKHRSERFLREACITGQLEHPNIVPVYEIGSRTDGSLYYTMRLLHGHTLAKALKGCKTLSDRLKLLGHLRDLCHAIAYAHSRGVVHRDIKPDNVIVGEFGETVVLDWGLAKAKGDTEVHDSVEVGPLPGPDPAGAPDADVNPSFTRQGELVGTPLYMSPEQARGQLDEVDEQSDVWALGVVLYELLAGCRPFDGESLTQVLYTLLFTPMRRVREVCPEAPAELAAIAERALIADKSQRYKTAGDMAADIEAYQHGLHVGAYRYSPWDLVRGFIARNRAAVTVGAVAALILLGGLVFSVQRIRAERDVALQERFVAQEQRDSARKFANLMLFDLAGGIARLPGSVPVQKQLVSSALRYYQQNVEPDTSQEADRRDLAWGYLKIADLALDAGRTDQARWAYNRADRIFTEIDSRQDVEVAAVRLGQLALAQGQATEGRRQFVRALEIIQQVATSSPNDGGVLDEQGEVYRHLADAAAIEQDYETSRQWLLKALTLVPKDGQHRSALASTYKKMGYLAVAEGNDAAASENLLKALGLFEADAAAAGEDADRQFALALACNDAGDNARAWKILSRLHAADPGKWEIALALAEVACASGHYPEAVAASERALEATRSMPDVQLMAHVFAAAAEYLQSHDDRALEHARSAIEAVGRHSPGLNAVFHGTLIDLRRLQSPRKGATIRLFENLQTAISKRGDVKAPLVEFADAIVSRSAPR